jgi:3-oxoacyl-[acyl-carrier protein] reductase
MSDRTLDGRKALVTGGSRGIGAASARRLAAAGADVALGYRDSAGPATALAGELEATGVRAAAFRADQADDAQVARLVKEAAGFLGGIDILVNSAGVSGTGLLGGGAESGPDGDRQWEVNVHGVVATTRAVLPHLPDDGRIITLTSVAADRNGVPAFGDYSATKAAVNAYTRAWAQELSPRGITVNTVQVGFAETDMVPPADSDVGRIFLAAIPMGRYARPEEVASAIAFLAGPEAGYVTGTALGVDGGWST